MSICLAHKIALDPTPAQRLFFERTAGVSRFTYNWALAEWKERYASGEKPKGHLLKKAFNALRRVQFPWTYEVHREATAQPFADLQKAFVNSFTIYELDPDSEPPGKVVGSVPSPIRPHGLAINSPLP